MVRFPTLTRAAGMAAFRCLYLLILALVMAACGSAPTPAPAPLCKPQTIVEALIQCQNENGLAVEHPCGAAEIPGCYNTGSPNVTCCPKEPASAGDGGAS